MRKLGYLLFISVLLIACKTQQQSGASVDISEETKLMVSYEQIDEVNGNSAEYKIELYSNRQMYLTAVKNLDKSGKYMRTISESEFKQIHKSFEEADFFSFNDEYVNDESKNPSKYLFLALGDKKKKVKHNAGAPEKLIELEFLMQSFLDRVGWEKLAW